MKQTLVPMPAGCAGEDELHELLGERRAFSRVADSCSAADAECLRRLRDERIYRMKQVTWAQFCVQYLDISRTEANRIIQRFEEFGERYFDVSRIVRISPESYRAIAHAVKDKTIEWNGETIALTPENSQRIAAAVQALRRAAAPKPVKPAGELAPLPAPAAALPMLERIDGLERRAWLLIAELRDLCHAAAYGRERQTIQRLTHELRQTLYDVEVHAA